MTKLCIYVKAPNGERVQCEVLEKMYSPETMFERAYVRALHGAPFNGQNCAVVQMTGNVTAVTVDDTAAHARSGKE